jgi:hypothetical protein
MRGKPDHVTPACGRHVGLQADITRRLQHLHQTPAWTPSCRPEARATYSGSHNHPIFPTRDYDSMNVYNRATGWGTFVALVLMAAFLSAEVWLLNWVHGFNAIVLHLLVVVLFVATLRFIFDGRRKPGRKYLIDPVTGKPNSPGR